jgi:hypothetical protein
LLRAERRLVDRAAYGLYALAGLLLGCAFLRQVFSVVLGLAYGVDASCCTDGRLAGFACWCCARCRARATINIAYNVSLLAGRTSCSTFTTTVTGQSFELHQTALMYVR